MFSIRKRRYTYGMQVMAKKTIRFAKLIEESGEPEQVTLWTAPEQDRDFQSAIREKRVVTVIHHNVGTKADYGLVGFVKESRTSFLVFPKSLHFPPETKVIGIKYDRISEKKPKGQLFKPNRRIKPGIPMRETPRWQRTGKVGRGKRLQSNVDRKPPEVEEVRSKRQRSDYLPERPPKLHRFRAEVKLVATQIVPLEVDAENVMRAAKLIRAKANELTMDLAEAELKKSASKPKKVM